MPWGGDCGPDSGRRSGASGRTVADEGEQVGGETYGVRCGRSDVRTTVSGRSQCVDVDENRTGVAAQHSSARIGRQTEGAASGQSDRPEASDQQMLVVAGALHPGQQTAVVGGGEAADTGELGQDPAAVEVDEATHAVGVDHGAASGHRHGFGGDRRVGDPTPDDVTVGGDERDRAFAHHPQS